MNTNDKYPTYILRDTLFSGSVEQMGGKPKEWLTYTLGGDELRILFKEGRPGTGENWAEKVTCELAGLLDLPHAIYDFALVREDTGTSKQYVISQKFVRDKEELIHGNLLIEGFNAANRSTTYTLDRILAALQNYNVLVPSYIKKIERLDVIKNAQDLFIGYLCFDGWISNTDRHEENWGVIVIDNIKFLAPTFDHASSLGRNVSDPQRIARMSTRDENYNVQAYIKKAKTPIYDENGKRLNAISVVEACKNRYPEITKFWIRKIVDVMSDELKILDILNKVPDEFISMPAKNFAMAMLQQSVELLRGLENE